MCYPNIKSVRTLIDIAKDKERMYILIDIANGHIDKLYMYVRLLKMKYPNVKLMVGNIAHPKMYIECCDAGVDYVRIGIGGGLGCTTSSNTSIHYPQATLINDCYLIKDELSKAYIELGKDIKKPQYLAIPKIVADGGIRNYSDVIKALALGADYVMVGGLFAAMYESAAPLMIKAVGDEWVGERLVEVDYKYENEEKKRLDIKNRQLWKEFYGMSTKKAQQLIDSNKSTKTAEGRHTYERVKYTVKQWTENMIDYMRSAMSYCNCKTLEEFVGKVDMIVNSPGEISAVNK